MNDRIEVVKGDITQLPVDIIVNAANSSLMGGGGVDGAIHKAAGPALLDACRNIIARQGSCKTGDAVITKAGNLPARFVIHTVGPVWNGGHKQEAEKLSACYQHSLQLAVAHNAVTIAFPNISTGIYGYPKEPAAAIATRTTIDFLDTNETIQKVYFVCFDEENYALYTAILR